mmetsp:Transcript_16380/g.38786  ORF Transcript_16380/g.38786 Transcript_16380/m.38786 type:complete len:215 (+) Transcript_16380:501-1145(+)
MRRAAELVSPSRMPLGHVVFDISPCSVNLHSLMWQHFLYKVDGCQQLRKFDEHALFLRSTSRKNSTSKISICKIRLQIIPAVETVNGHAILHKHDRAEGLITEAGLSQGLPLDNDLLLHEGLALLGHLPEVDQYSHKNEVLPTPLPAVVAPKLLEAKARHVRTSIPISPQEAEKAASQDLQALPSRNFKPGDSEAATAWLWDLAGKRLRSAVDW